MKAITLILVMLVFTANCYTIMNSCMPTDYKGVFKRTEILSMSFAMNYESGLKRTTYLVGGHSKQTKTSEIDGTDGRQFREVNTVEGFLFTFVQSGSECEV